MGNFPQPDSDLDLGPVQMPSLEYKYSGNVFWLGSGDATAGIQASSAPLITGSTRDRPVSTFAAAMALCLANRGDTVYVEPSYAENMTATSHAMTKAGVNVIGLSGLGNRRPTITATATGSIFTMGAVGCSIKNLLFVNGVASHVTMITVASATSNGATDCTIESCEVRMNNAGDTTWTATGILTNANASRLTVRDCLITGSGASAGAGTVRHTNAITIVGGDSITIAGGECNGRFSATLGCIQIITTLSTNLRILGSEKGPLRLLNMTTSATKTIVDTITGTTGIIDGTRNQVLAQVAGPATVPFTCATMYKGVNYASYQVGDAEALLTV